MNYHKYFQKLIKKYFKKMLTNKVVNDTIMTRIVVNYFERRADGIS